MGYLGSSIYARRPQFVYPVCHIRIAINHAELISANRGLQPKYLTCTCSRGCNPLCFQYFKRSRRSITSTYTRHRELCLTGLNPFQENRYYRREYVVHHHSTLLPRILTGPAKHQHGAGLPQLCPCQWYYKSRLAATVVVAGIIRTFVVSSFVSADEILHLSPLTSATTVIIARSLSPPLRLAPWDESLKPNPIAGETAQGSNPAPTQRSANRVAAIIIPWRAGAQNRESSGTPDVVPVPNSLVVTSAGLRNLVTRKGHLTLYCVKPGRDGSR